MRLRLTGDEDEREAAFLAALARGSDESADPADQATHRKHRAPSAADIVEAVLHFHDAPSGLVHRVLQCRGADPAGLLAVGLKAALKFCPLPEAARCRLMLIGPPGAGKTTITAKLAAGGRLPRLRVFTTDGERPGGLEQLADPLAVLGIEPQRLDADAETLPDSEGALLVDTAGTDAGAGNGFDALGQLARRLALEPVLVLPATIDADEARKFAVAASAAGAGKLLLTRLDMARRLGGPLAAAAAGQALAGASVTPHFAYGLKSLGPDTLAGHLLDLARRHLAAP
jgi:flagellar biosynthesis protein FlhF